MVKVGRLLAKVRQVPTRAEELASLKKRIAAAVKEKPDADEKAAAQEVLAAKLALAEATGEVSSCATCAKGKPMPRGAYDGGDCCSGVTADLFDDPALAALVQTGTRMKDLVAPHEAHVGCAFRGPVGCTLEVDHRPAVCVRYFCQGLRRELHRGGKLDEIEKKIEALDHAVMRHTMIRAERLDREIFES